MAENPAPDAIRAARKRAGLTQTGMARLIYSTLRTVQEWEAGNRSMHPAMWLVFRHLAGLERIPFRRR